MPPPKPKKEMLSGENVGVEAEEAVSVFDDSLQLLHAPADIGFSDVYKYSFKAGRCVNCHTDDGKNFDHSATFHGADLNDYQSVFLMGGIVTGKPHESAIYKASESEEFHPEVKGYSPLKPEALKLLKLWILNCAIEVPPENDIGLIQNPVKKEKIRLCY